MSTTLRAIAREMINRNPTAIGRLLTINSLTTTTAVCNTLATGGLSSNAFATDYMVRRDASAASAADRIRYAPSFATSTGTLTHSGTNYADTTATSETLELLHFHPDLIDQAIQVTLGRLRRIHHYILPARTGVTRYQLNDLSWVTQPSDIHKIRVHTDGILSGNANMEQWNSYDTSGNLQPDLWSVTNSMTMARSTTGTRPGDGYVVSLTRPGSNSLFYQAFGTLDSDVSADTLRSQAVTVVGVINSSVASQVRVYIDDGTATYSSYHTGGGGWEELTKQVTISSTATKLDFGVSVETSNTVCYVNRLYLVFGAVTDNHRRGRGQGTLLPKGAFDFDQGNQTILLPVQSRGAVYEIETARAYPQFDSARLTAGTADADASDAPVTVVATGAIGRLFEGLAENESNSDTRARYAQIAAAWNKRFEQLALSHLGVTPQNGFGVDLPFARATSRVGRI